MSNTSSLAETRSAGIVRSDSATTLVVPKAINLSSGEREETHRAPRPTTARLGRDSYVADLGQHGREELDWGYSTGDDGGLMAFSRTGSELLDCAASTVLHRCRRDGDPRRGWASRAFGTIANPSKPTTVS